jgi:hypothetical protein
MHTLTAVVAILSVLGFPAAVQELKRLPLDDAGAIGLSIQADPDVKVEGKASIRIVTKWATTVCLGEVGALDIENARLVYSAKVRTDLQGSAFLELWAHVAGGQYFSRGLDQQLSGKSDWKTVRALFLLQKGQKPDKVTLNVVINGPGTVWVDDITLTREPL